MAEEEAPRRGGLYRNAVSLVGALISGRKHPPHHLRPRPRVQPQAAQPLHRHLHLHGVPHVLRRGRGRLPVRHVAREPAPARRGKRRGARVPPRRPEHPEAPEAVHLRRARGDVPLRVHGVRDVQRLPVQRVRLLLRHPVPHRDGAGVRGVPGVPARTGELRGLPRGARRLLVRPGEDLRGAPGPRRHDEVVSRVPSPPRSRTCAPRGRRARSATGRRSSSAPS